MSEILDAYWAAPPMARTLATAIVVTSLAVHFTPFLDGYQIYFSTHRLLRFPPEIWRLVTSFLLSGDGLQLILDPLWAYQNLRSLEVGHPKFGRREDVLWYLITVGGFIIVLNELYFGSPFYLQALIVAMCYTATQDQRGQKANFFFFTIPAQALPYCMLIMSALTNGPVALQFSGILAAHLHDFLFRLWPEFGGGPNMLATPAFVSRLIQTPRFFQRGYGTAVRPAAAAAAAAPGRSTGASTGSVLPDSWKTRGSGHRLG